MKRIWMQLLIGLVGTAAVSYAGTVGMQICYSSAPDAPDTPGWGAYIPNAILGLENGCQSEPDATYVPGSYAAITSLAASDMVVTSFASWQGQANPSPYSGENGNRLMAGLIINGNGTQFSLSQLTFDMESNDPSDSMQFVGNFIGYSYTPWRVGIINATSTSPMEVLDSGEAGTTPVDELYYTGIGNALWPGCGTPLPDPNDNGWTDSTCGGDPALGQQVLDDQLNYINSVNYPGFFTGAHHLLARDPRTPSRPSHRISQPLPSLPTSF